MELGAERVILGSSLIREGEPDVTFAESLAEACGVDKIVAAIDSRGGHVAVRGWREATKLTAEEMIEAIDPFVSGYLYTHVDTEGMLAGFPLSAHEHITGNHQGNLIAAGGIRSQEEIDELDANRSGCGRGDGNLHRQTRR